MKTAGSANTWAGVSDLSSEAGEAVWSGWSGSGVTDQVGQDLWTGLWAKECGSTSITGPGSENTSHRMWGSEQSSAAAADAPDHAALMATSLWPSRLSWACCHVLTGVPPSACCQSDPVTLCLGLKLWMLKPGVHLPDLQFKALHTLATLLLSSHFLTAHILHSAFTGPPASLKTQLVSVPETSSTSVSTL